MRSAFIVLLLLPCLLAAQQGQPRTNVVRDTSFTVESTEAKILRQYPFVRTANPQVPAGVRVHENLVYSTAGGRDLHLDILVPAATRTTPAPAVILLHGGGWKSGDRSQTIPMARRLAGDGFVAVAVEYRLSPEALYPAAVHDAKAAVRWLRSRGKEFGIDTEKIAALGCSAGGQLAAFLGTTNNNPLFEGTTGTPEYSSAVQAVIDIDGVLDFGTPDEIGKDSVAAKTKAASLWFGATFFEKPEIWREASPITHVGSETPPIAFINSALERFHFGRDAMINRMNDLGIPSEVHTLPDTPHPFWFFEPWFGTTCSYVTSFLNKTFNTARR
jgi:pectinesterase